MFLKKFRKLSAIMASAAALAVPVAALPADITGTGATFPYPICAKWADAYKKATGIGLNYQSIGSGGGIKQISAKTVDLGASDMPLKPEVLDKEGLMQFPTVIGGAIPAVNLKGIKPGELKLSAEAISLVHRSDGSGTTFIWPNYLSTVSPEWKEKVGEGTSVNWPTGVGGKGNEGVASYVQRINGSIGYAEYAYVLQNKMTYALVKNRDGHFIALRRGCT